MKIGIMQPYFFPYIGYFQLINAVDFFVIYDNIQYTKKGWINRNRYLMNGKHYLFSLPLKKDSDFLDIRDRYLADSYTQERKKILARITHAYKSAPFFSQVIPIIESCLMYQENNLFKFIFYSIQQICKYLNIGTTLIISSSINANHQMKGQDRVISICKAMKASHYINTLGGITLYSKHDFNEQGIQLSFINSKDIMYQQFENDFIPNLSIIDVMMFNSRKNTDIMLDNYELT